MRPTACIAAEGPPCAGLRASGIRAPTSGDPDGVRPASTGAAEAGIRAAKPSYEGVRLVFPNGWALLRMSLHDPQMPLNIESRKKGGVAEIAAKVQVFLKGFTSLHMSVFKD